MQSPVNSTSITRAMAPGRSAWRRLLRGLLALMLTGLILLLLLPWWLHSDWARQAAQHWLQTRYQRTLQLREPWRLHWQGGGQVQLRIRGLSLSEAASTQSMLQLDELSVQLALPALLQRRIELTGVELHSASLVLRRNAAGRWNVADLLPDPQAPPSAWQWSLARLVARDVRLSWQDQMTARTLDLTLDALHLGALSESAQGQLQLHATLKSAWPLRAGLQASPLSVQFACHYDIDVAQQRFTLQEVRGRLALLPADATEQGGPLPGHWQAGVRAHDWQFAPGHWQGRQLELDLETGADWLPGWPAQTSRWSVALLDHEAARLALSGLQAELALQQDAYRLDAQLAGSLDWQHSSGQLQASLTQLSAQLQHPRLSKTLPLTVRAELALQQMPAAVEAQLQLHGELAHDPLRLQLGYSAGTAPRAQLNIDAHLARLDADAWLTPGAAAATPVLPGQAGQAQDNRPGLPFELNGQLQVDALKFAGIRLKGVRFSAQAIDNWLQGFR